MEGYWSGFGMAGADIEVGGSAGQTGEING
jgi:hypothetical protein